MHLQDVLTPLDVRITYRDLTVKAARTQQRRVQNIRTVGRRDYDQTLVRTKAIHLYQKLVQCLLPLIVASAKTGSSVTAYCVDFIDEYNTCRRFPRRIEQVPHARGADTYIHLHKI